MLCFGVGAPNSPSPSDGEASVLGPIAMLLIPFIFLGALLLVSGLKWLHTPHCRSTAQRAGNSCYRQPEGPVTQEMPVTTDPSSELNLLRSFQPCISVIL